MTERPILVLKKKRVVATVSPPSPPLMPVLASLPLSSRLGGLKKPKPPVSASLPPQPQIKKIKVSTPSKAGIRAANTLESERKLAEKKAALARLLPLVEVHFHSHPAVVACCPLAIGVGKIILAWLQQQPAAENCSLTTLREAVNSIIEKHVGRKEYVEKILNSEQRFQLDGKEDVSTIVKQHKRNAEWKLANMATLS